MAKLKNIFKPAISWINKNANFRPLLRSRLILYFIFILSLFNLYSFTISNGSGDSIYAAIFILVGFLTSFFSKNMIVIMVCALAVSNILKYGLGIRVQDGFTTNDSENKSNDDNTDEPDKSDKTETPDATEPADSSNKNTDTSSKTDSSNKNTEPKKASPTVAPIKTQKETSVNSSDIIDQVQKMTSSGNISDMKDKLQKALTDINKHKSEDPEKASDFKNVVNVQLELLDKMSELSPLISNAKSAMDVIKKYE